MASKNSTRAFRREFDRLMLEHPEIVKEQRLAIAADRIECALLMCIDYMWHIDRPVEEMQGLLDHVLNTFKCVSYHNMDDFGGDFFKTMNDQLKEDTGIEVQGFIVNQIGDINNADSN